MGEVMKFCLSNFKDFKNILTTAELVLNEIKFEMDNDGLRFRGFDGGRTSFFFVDFKKEYFDEYSIDEPETIIVDSSEITKVMKRIKNDDDVCVIVDDYHMRIKVNGKKSFKINALDLEYDSPNLPHIEFPVSTMVDFNDLKDSVNDSSLYSDSFYIQSTEGALVITATGTLGEYESELLVGDELESNCKSMFRNNLLASFFKLSNLSDMVSVKIGHQHPILLTINDELGELSVELLVAPRIEEY